MLPYKYSQHFINFDAFKTRGGSGRIVIRFLVLGLNFVPGISAKFNCLSIQARMTFISNMANLEPTHIRGPTRNGTNLYRFFVASSSSNLSGLNVFASSKSFSDLHEKHVMRIIIWIGLTKYILEMFWLLLIFEL